MNEIQSTGFGGQDERVVQFAQNERPKPEGIPHPDYFLFSHQHQRERTLHLS
jgi:hypothetical protein